MCTRASDLGPRGVRPRASGTSEPYAVAKIAGIRLCQAYRRQHGCGFISAIPTTLYGPGDNFEPAQSHVMSARREFLHVDDAAEACVFLMEQYDGDDDVNVGTGKDLPIGELADMLRDVIYPEARLTFDSSKPDGAPRKLLDVTRLHALGWRHRIALREGVVSTYR